MIGAARSESSQVLCSTMVFLPPMKISEVYSSMALLLSPTYGTYCKKMGKFPSKSNICILFLHKVKDQLTDLDNDNMIRMLARLVENTIARNHVIHHVTLGDLFGSECLRC
jgi:hypothetical protein